jgi:hypothetical protein
MRNNSLSQQSASTRGLGGGGVNEAINSPPCSAGTLNVGRIRWISTENYENQSAVKFGNRAMTAKFKNSYFSRVGLMS